MIKNQWALITGATSGIGKSFAYHYAQQGYHLLITGTRTELLEKVADGIRHQYEVMVETFIGDLSCEDNHKKLIAITQTKEISVLINNAGYGYNAYFYDGDLDIFLDMLELHTKLVVKLTYAVLPYMRKMNRGTIINISSPATYIIAKKNAIYSGTKAFIKQFTHGLYLDLYDTDINIVAVCPGFTKTDAHKRMGISEKRKESAFIKFASPEFVVNETMKALKKRKAVCITGMSTKIQVLMGLFMPKKIYYRIINTLFQ